uniref:Uncharacterized protein n=1 Tax=Sphaerodactylus townsendi TaxID=933632 RepID=A0ACB8G695_9SAUR
MPTSPSVYNGALGSHHRFCRHSSHRNVRSSHRFYLRNILHCFHCNIPHCSGFAEMKKILHHNIPHGCYLHRHNSCHNSNLLLSVVVGSSFLCFE